MDYIFVILMKGCWMFFFLCDVQYGFGGEIEKYKMLILVFEIYFVSGELFFLFLEVNMVDIYVNYLVVQNEYNFGQDV